MVKFPKFLYDKVTLHYTMIKFSLNREQVQAYHPSRGQLTRWIRASLQHKYLNVVLSLSLVSAEDSQQLNLSYRGQDKATNVISVEYAAGRAEYSLLSGELILCDAVIISEAAQQQKPLLAHYAHLLIHGLLHLQGYDHIDDSEAEQMEQLEITILAKLGFANPYISDKTNSAIAEKSCF